MKAAQKPQLVADRVAIESGRPRAGRKLVVRVHVARLDTADAVATARVVCRARVHGRVLTTRAKTFSAATATCAWRLPRGSRGDIVQGAVTVRSEGLRAHRRFWLRIS